MHTNCTKCAKLHFFIRIGTSLKSLAPFNTKLHEAASVKMDIYIFQCINITFRNIHCPHLSKISMRQISCLYNVLQMNDMKTTAEEKICHFSVVNRKVSFSKHFSVFLVSLVSL